MINIYLIVFLCRAVPEAKASRSGNISFDEITNFFLCVGKSKKKKSSSLKNKRSQKLSDTKKRRNKQKISNKKHQKNAKSK